MSVALHALERITSGHPNEDLATDLVLLQRLEALPEQQILSYFWTIVRQTDDRLGVLLQLTKVVVQRPADWDYATVRRDHERHYHSGRTLTVDRSRCFGCEAGQRLYLHHILEVQHGGSNAARNLVPLCFSCHQYLHPWLTEEPSPVKVRGFESIWQIGKRLFRL